MEENTVMANPWETPPPQTQPEHQALPWETLPPQEGPIANTAAIDKYLTSQPGMQEAQNPLEALKAGLQMSATGLSLNRPSVEVPQNASFMEKLAYGVGQGLGDTPQGLVGGFMGALGGGAVTAETGGWGAVPGGGAGFMAAPEAVRQLMLDHYQDNTHRTWEDFFKSFAERTWEVGKASIVGGLAPGAGKVATKVVSGLTKSSFAKTSASLGGYVVGATSLSAGLNGQMPNAEDFAIGATQAIGFHIAGKYVGNNFVLSKAGEQARHNMQQIYADTGIPPWQQANMAKRDPTFRQELLAHDVSGNPVTTKFNQSRIPDPEPYVPPKLPAPGIPPTPANMTETGNRFEYRFGDSNGGIIAGKMLDDGYQVKVAHNPNWETQRGQGTQAYRDLADHVLAQGKVLYSDASVTAPAARVYDRLKALGYSVERNPRADSDMEGTHFAPIGDKNNWVYKITAGPKTDGFKTNAFKVQEGHDQQVQDINSDAYRAQHIDTILNKINVYGERSDAAAAAQNRSGGHVTADTVVSPAGAIGRYQIMPGTARQYGYDPARLTDPVYNKKVATAVLNDLHIRFHGDEAAILVAYNAGPGRATRWLNSGRDPNALPRETQNYLDRSGVEQIAGVRPGKPPVKLEYPDVERSVGWRADAEGNLVPNDDAVASYMGKIGKDLGITFQAWPSSAKAVAVGSLTARNMYGHQTWTDDGGLRSRGTIRFDAGEQEKPAEAFRQEYGGLSPNQVLYHEISHAIDAKIVGEGRGMTSKLPPEIEAEVTAAARSFHPFQNKSPAYVKYKNGPKEIMADAIAGYLSDPALRARMPAFTEHLRSTGKLADLEKYAAILDKNVPTKAGLAWVPPPGEAGKAWADVEQRLLGWHERMSGGSGGAGGTGAPPPPKGPGGQAALPAPEGPDFTRLTTESRLARFRDSIGEPPEQAGQWSLSRLTKQWVSELQTAREIDAEMKTRGLLDPNKDISTEDMFRQTYASDGRAGHFFFRGIIDPVTFEPKPGPSLQNVIEKIRDVGGSIDEFNLYRVAMRTVEKAKQGIDTGVFPGGLREAQASALDPALQKYRVVNEAMQEWKHGGLEYGRDSGLFSQAQMEAMERANTSHVSLRRIMGDDSAFAQGMFGRTFRVRNPLKLMEGSDRQIVQPLTADMDNLRQIIAMADRNRAIGHLVGSAEARDVLGLLKIEGPPKPTLAEPGSNTFRPYAMTPEEAKGFEPFVAAKDKKAVKGNQFTFYRDGKPEVWEAKNEDVATLLRGADSPGEANMILKLLQWPAKMMRTGTIFMPDFAVRVGVANELSAYIMDPSHPTPFLTFAKGAMEPWKKGDQFWDWVAHGGGGVALRDLDKTYVTRDFQRLLDESGADNGMWNAVKHPLEMAQIINERLDTAPRIGVYKSEVAKGTDKTKAAMISRRASLDYAERGTSEFVNQLAKTIPFFRASLLGINQAGKAMQPNRLLGTAMRVGAASVLPAVMLWALNHEADKELDDSDKYSAISRDLKDMYFVTPPINGVRIKMRRPFQLGFTGALVDRFLDAELARDPKAMDDWVGTIIKDNLPPLIPTAVAPLLEGLSNHSFYSGRPLIPDSLKSASPDMQYTDYTSELAKNISKTLGTHQGLGVTDISPIIIDNYVREWTGALGGQVLKALDVPLGKEPTRPGFDVADLPFISGFVLRRPGMSSQVVTDFYDEAAKYEAMHADKVLEVKQGNIEQAEKDYVNGGNKVVTIGRIKHALAVQRLALKAIMKNDDMTVNDKRQLSERIYNDAIAISKFGSQILKGDVPGADDTAAMSERIQSNIEASGLSEQSQTLAEQANK
jgi:hypothetical protein